MKRSMEQRIDELEQMIKDLGQGVACRDCPRYQICGRRDMLANLQRIRGIEGQSLRLFGRVAKADGTWGDTTNVTGIAAKTKKTGQDATEDNLTAQIATLMFDELQTSDPAWEDDVNDARIERGYNFAWTVPAANFASDGWYVIEIAFTFSGGEVTKLLFEGPVRGAL